VPAVNTATSTVGKPIETGLQPVAIAITARHRRPDRRALWLPG
jgi:hypothetical protein